MLHQLKSRRFGKTGKRVLSAVLCAAVVSGAPVSAFASSSSSVSPSCDEAYYGTLDYYGNLTDGGVVKSYRLNGVSTIHDYGTYDKVINMTDSVKPTISGGKVTFDFSNDKDKPDAFYFEGKTSKPFQNLPWTVKISYRLNGADAKAEDLAGKTGLVEINVDIVPQSSASDYFKNNLVLVGMSSFNANDIVSLEAEGAQVQLLGNLRTVTFLALPGEEQHISIRVGSNSFSCDGLTFLAVPATLSQLGKISTLQKDKSKVENSYQAICNSLDVVLNTMEGMSGSLEKSAEGLDELNRARAIVSAGRSSVSSSMDSALSGLDVFASTLKPLAGGVDAAEKVLSDMAPQLASLTSSADSVKSQLSNIRTAISNVQGDMNQLSGLSKAAGASVSGAKRIVAGAQMDLATLSADLKGLRSSLSGLNDTVSLISGDLPTSSSSELLKLLRAEAQPISGLKTKVDNVNAAYTQYEALKEAQPALSGLSFKDFLAKDTDLKNLPAVEAGAKAGEAAALWDLEQEFNSSAKLDNILNEVEKLYDTNIPALQEQAKTIAALHDTAYPAYLKAAGKTEKEIPFQQFLMTGLNSVTGKTNLSELDAGKASRFWNLMQDFGGTSRFEEFLSRASKIYRDDLCLDQLEQANQIASQYQQAVKQYPSLTLAQFLQQAAAKQGISLSSTDAAEQATEIQQLLQLEKKMAADSDKNHTLESYLNQIQSVIDAGNTDIRTIDTQIEKINTAVNAMKAAIIPVLSSLEDVSGTLAEPGLIGDIRQMNTLLGSLLSALDLHKNDIPAAVSSINGLGTAVSGLSGSLESSLDTFEALNSTVSQRLPQVSGALDNMKKASQGAEAAITGVDSALRSIKSLAEQSSPQMDSGAEKTLTGISDTLRRAAQGLSQTGTLRSAKQTLTDLIDEEWKAHTGGEDNLLNMDASAQPVSLTSGQNETPKSIQFVLRTKEIKASQTTEKRSTTTSQQKAPSSSGGFWQRFGGIFVGLWNGFIGLFQH